MTPERRPFDRERLSPSSRQFAERLFAAHPAFQAGASNTDSPRAAQGDLRVEVASPTGDPRRALVLWVENEEPRLSFGGWQTRASLWGGADAVAPILRVVNAILANEVVLLVDLRGDPTVTPGMVDLSEEGSLLEELQRHWSTNRMSLRSWTGAADRELAPSDVK